ncbi:MAG: hypothetical protein IIA17_05950 [candidate division Zixibacteria bacterium]|nr:hypothetical protein [candidate division Zixibacteria bacterium]
MSNFVIILSAALFLLALATLIRLRVKLDLYPNVKTLFAGLGRTGIRIDITGKTRAFIFAGRTIKTFSTEKKPDRKTAGEKTKTVKKQKPGRQRPLKKILAVVPTTLKALSNYTYSILKSAAIEEFDGQINAGFGPPHITGAAFGFYQATLAGIPGMAGRFKYIPDWNGLSFQGQLRISVSIPLYRLLFKTMVMLWQLPLRELIKLAIGTKKATPEAMPKGK